MKKTTSVSRVSSARENCIRPCPRLLAIISVTCGATVTLKALRGIRKCRRDTGRIVVRKKRQINNTASLSKSSDESRSVIYFVRYIKLKTRRRGWERDFSETYTRAVSCQLRDAINIDTDIDCYGAIYVYAEYIYSGCNF